MNALSLKHVLRLHPSAKPTFSSTRTFTNSQQLQDHKTKKAREHAKRMIQSQKLDEQRPKWDPDTVAKFQFILKRGSEMPATYGIKPTHKYVIDTSLLRSLIHPEPKPMFLNDEPFDPTDCYISPSSIYDLWGSSKNPIGRPKFGSMPLRSDVRAFAENYSLKIYEPDQYATEMVLMRFRRALFELENTNFDWAQKQVLSSAWVREDFSRGIVRLACEAAGGGYGFLTKEHSFARRWPFLLESMGMRWAKVLVPEPGPDGNSYVLEKIKKETQETKERTG